MKKRRHFQAETKLELAKFSISAAVRVPLSRRIDWGTVEWLATRTKRFRRAVLWLGNVSQMMQPVIYNLQAYVPVPRDVSILSDKQTSTISFIECALSRKPNVAKKKSRQNSTRSVEQHPANRSTALNPWNLPRRLSAPPEKRSRRSRRRDGRKPKLKGRGLSKKVSLIFYSLRVWAYRTTYTKQKGT